MNPITAVSPSTVVVMSVSVSEAVPVSEFVLDRHTARTLAVLGGSVADLFQTRGPM